MNIALVVPAVVGVPYRGAWAEGVLYYINDVVEHLGKAYASLQEHVSSKRHTPGAAPFFWREV